jgi:SAM-dependent methyltransferase
MSKIKLLHVGCGRAPLPEWMVGIFEEVRLDIDPDVEPDVCASMADMGDIGPFDTVLTNHTLEHLYPHEVLPALREIRRVLRPGGGLVLSVPDLEGVQPTDETVYDSPAGPVSGLDMIYGMARITATSKYNAHHCGFVQSTLAGVIEAAGFRNVTVDRIAHNLVAVAYA